MIPRHSPLGLKLRIFRAAGVHLYTTFGGVLAFFALVEIADGHFERALLLLTVTLVVDGSDGYMARRLRVSEVLPNINGETLDSIIDFTTVVIAPLFLLWRAALLPYPAWAWAVLVLLAAYYSSVTTDQLKHRGLYTGLPAMWNLYAFHVYYVRPSEPVQMACIAVLFILTFVPAHFIYVSRFNHLQTAKLVAVVSYLAIVLAVILHVIDHRREWALMALAFPVCYFGASVWAELRLRRGLLPPQ
jgi:phosphatidylcholine synthase